MLKFFSGLVVGAALVYLISNYPQETKNYGKVAVDTVASAAASGIVAGQKAADQELTKPASKK
jgi:hypothetical protein